MECNKKIIHTAINLIYLLAAVSLAQIPNALR